MMNYKVAATKYIDDVQSMPGILQIAVESLYRQIQTRKEEIVTYVLQHAYGLTLSEAKGRLFHINDEERPEEELYYLDTDIERKDFGKFIASFTYKTPASIRDYDMTRIKAMLDVKTPITIPTSLSPLA